MSEKTKPFYVAKDLDGLELMFENEPKFGSVDWRAEGACATLNSGDARLFSGKHIKPGVECIKVDIDTLSNAFFPYRRKFGIS